MAEMSSGAGNRGSLPGQASTGIRYLEKKPQWQPPLIYTVLGGVGYFA